MDTYQAVYDAVRSKITSCDVGSVVADVIRQSADFSYAIAAIQQEACYSFASHSRPSVLFRPRVFIDGNMWCALYGDNLQDGCAGFGESISAAMDDFDKNWSKPVGKGTRK